MISTAAVSARATELDPAAGARRAGRGLLTLVAALLVGIGWVAARTVTTTVTAALWAAAALSVGWTTARPPKERKS